MSSGPKSTTTQGASLPKELQPAYMNAAKQWTDPSSRDKAMQFSFFDPSVVGQIGESWKKEAFRSDDAVLGRPETTSYINALTSNSNKNLDQNLANLRGRFAKFGHTSTGASQPLTTAQAQATSSSQADLDNILAGQLFNLYQQQIAQRLSALGQLQNYQAIPSQMMESFANMFKTNTSTSTTKRGDLDVFSQFASGGK